MMDDSDPFGRETSARGPRPANTVSQRVFRSDNVENDMDQPLIEGNRDSAVVEEQPMIERRVRDQDADAEPNEPPPPPRAVFAPPEPTYQNNCSRIFTMTFSIFLLLAGAVVAIMGRVERDYHVFPLCPKCTTLTTVMFIAGSVMAVLGLIGFVGGWTRWKPVSFFFAFVLFFVAVLCFAIGSLFVVFDLDLSPKEVKTLWDDAVSDDDGFICDVQNNLKCAGFNTCCSEDLCNVTVVTYVQQCDPACNTSNAMYSQPCEDKLTDLIKSHFAPLVGVGYGLFVVFFAAMVASVRATLLSDAPRARSAING